MTKHDLTPLYRRISDELVAEIAAGRLAAGAALPSEHALCERFGVSRITVRKALDELTLQGRVERRRGVGNFVRDSDRRSWSATLTGVLEDVLTPHRPEITREDLVCPPDDVLLFAHLPPDAQFKLFEGINYNEERRPLVHLRYYFPTDVAAKLTAGSLSGPLQAIKVVELATGSVIDYAEQIVEAMIAKGEVATGLGIEPGTAVLRAIRVYYDRFRRPIEILEAAYHPTRYRYTAKLYPRER